MAPAHMRLRLRLRLRLPLWRVVQLRLLREARGVGLHRHVVRRGWRAVGVLSES